MKMAKWFRTHRYAERRALSGLLALVMTLGLAGVALPGVRAEAEDSVTEVWVYHQYLSQGDVSTEVQLTAESDPLVVEPIPVLDDAGNELESFSGFSVENGDAAVELQTSNPEDPKAVIRYNPDVPLVILHVYYHYNVAYYGVDFTSAKLPDDQDVAEVTAENIDEIITCNRDLDGLISVGDRVYNTGAGLHTEAQATVADQTSRNYSELNKPLNDGRTFDVTLESWFAKNNPTDVGFILDASGSMAFLDDDVDKGVGVFSRGERDSDYDFEPTWIEYAGGGENYNEVYEAVYDEYGEFVLLPQDAVDQLLNKTYTDSTSLAYNDYQYYVYDSRDSVRELVPLGYWDGNMGGTESPLLTGLVGMYQFDRTKVGDDEANFYKNSAPGGGEATQGTANHNKTGGDYKEDVSKKTATPTKGAFQAYVISDGTPSHSTLDLDAVVTHPEKFTLSFAVKTNNTDAINSSRHDSGGPQAEDLVTIKDADGHELYTILRGTRGSGNSQNHVRWQDADKTTYANLNGAI